ncbi:MAG: hypothetical protein WC489_04225 [Patescibacteria group bacterium]
MKPATTNIKKKLISLILLFCVITLALQVTTVSAQTTMPLTVGPARQQITINPGESAPFAVKFYNQGEFPLTGIVKVADFVVQSNDGAPRIIDDIKTANPKYSASGWTTLSFDRAAIDANDRAIITGNISVPKDARPGGRYIAVYFEPSISTPQSVEGASQGTTPRIASLIYIRVAGPITENAIISSLFAKSFYEYGPIKVNSEILNRGDYHIRPRGILTLSNSIDGLVEQSSLREENIFPDAARMYENSLGSKWMMGRYKINLAASYGEKGQALERSIYVWVFPWKVATIVLLAVLIIILISRNMYKKIVVKESVLEAEVEKEKEEIEKLKEELRNRKE